MKTRAKQEMGYSGPRDMLEVGSPEWCRRTVIRLKTVWGGVEDDAERVQGALAEIEAARLYTIWPPGRPYGSMDELLKAEVGVSLAEVWGRIASAAQRSRRAAEVTTGQVLPKGSVNQHTLAAAVDKIGQPQGERAAGSGVSRETQRKLDYLARKDTALLAQVQAGTRSVDAAYRQATGKPPQVRVMATVEGFARAARAHLPPDQWPALAEALHREEDDL